MAIFIDANVFMIRMKSQKEVYYNIYKFDFFYFLSHLLIFFSSFHLACAGVLLYVLD